MITDGVPMFPTQTKSERHPFGATPCLGECVDAGARNTTPASSLYLQPDEKQFRKQLKSCTFRVGSTVLPSQLA